MLSAIHQRTSIVFRTEEENCPVAASQGPGPPVNGTALQLEVTGRKVLTPINLVSGELSIRAQQRGGPLAWQLSAWWASLGPLWWGRHWPACLSPIKHLLLIQAQGEGTGASLNDTRISYGLRTRWRGWMDGCSIRGHLDTIVLHMWDSISRLSSCHPYLDASHFRVTERGSFHPREEHLKYCKCRIVLQIYLQCFEIIFLVFKKYPAEGIALVCEGVVIYSNHILKCMLQQTTNLNGDDSSAPSCYDGNKAISRITRQSGKYKMLWD